MDDYFRIGLRESRTLIVCESAIDAISCERLNPGCLCISTSGARPNPLWLQELLDRGNTMHCGFNNDPAGESAAAMLDLHPAIHRRRPPAHDWNDARTKRHRSRSQKFKKAVPGRPQGLIQKRVQAVGPEKFGVVAVDCAKARSKWMLTDFYGKVLVQPTDVEHNRSSFQLAVVNPTFPVR